MRRLTIEKPAKEMNMTELAYNCMYAKDGWAWYRDFDHAMDLRDFIREFSAAVGACELPEDNEELDEVLIDDLQYDIDNPSGRVALIYRLMCAMADLREMLKAYEDIELMPEELVMLKDRDKVMKMYKPNPNIYCCPACGEKLAPMWDFCPWCGQHLID